MANPKAIKCPIYNFIQVPPLCQKFIDTVSFQRLERIKQLGLCVKVYPSACHTRKEHSLGVMHLAGVVVDQLRQFVAITDRQKELIQLGALYHDIGHSAYSHMFDVFLESIPCTDMLDEFFRLTHHEDRSILLLNRENVRLGLLTPDEVTFVSDVILGNVPPGEGTKQYYLYEIVNNKLCGIDVDKMDYLRRDSYHTGLPSFQSAYIVSCMVVDASNHIGFKPKAEIDLSDLFHTRYRMFQQVYYHHTVQKLERMYKCAMKRIGPQLFQYGAMTDDMNVETLLRCSESTNILMEQIDMRIFEHSCEFCEEFSTEASIKQSGSISDVIFV